MSKRNDAPPAEGNGKDGQAPDSQGSEAPLFDSQEAAEAYITTLRAENAAHRIKAREAEQRAKDLDERLKAIEKNSKAAETKRLEDDQKWEELASQRATELAAAQEALEKERAATQAHLLNAAIRTRLAAAGVTDPADQDFVIPSVKAFAKPKLGDDFKVTYENEEEAFRRAAALAGANPNGEKKKTPATAAGVSDVLGNQLPASSRGSNQLDPNSDDDWRRELEEAIRGG